MMIVSFDDGSCAPIIVCEHTLVFFCCWRFVGNVLMYNKLLLKSMSLTLSWFGCYSHKGSEHQYKCRSFFSSPMLESNTSSLLLLNLKSAYPSAM